MQRTHWLTLGGKAIEFVTIAWIAENSGKSKITIRKWEEKGWLPMANWFLPINEKIPMKGKQRMYTKKYATMLAGVIKQAAKGVEVSQELKTELSRIIKSEREEFSPKQ